jgi:hypothetical protein
MLGRCPHANQSFSFATAIVSAPLWDSHTSRFAGLLTATDYMNVIQYYCQFPEEMSKLDQFRLSSLRGKHRRLSLTWNISLTSRGIQT